MSLIVPDLDALRNASLLLWEWLCRLDEPLKARAVLENAPYLLDNDAALAEARRRTEGMISHLANEQSYAAHYLTQWEADVPQSIAEIEAAAEFYPRAHWTLASLRESGAESCIDLGSGNGYLCLFLARHGIRSLGLNLTREAVDVCTNVASRLGLPAQFRLADASIKHDDLLGRFDAGVAFEIAEHVSDDLALVDILTRCVRPGGRVLITAPVGSTTYGSDTWAERGGPPDSPQAHVRVYTERTFRKLFRNLRDVRISTQLASRSEGAPLVFAGAGRTPELRSASATSG